MSQDAIFDLWTSNSEHGTRHHANIEDFYNTRLYQTESKEFKLFSIFHQWTVDRGWVPYRTEWLIYSLRLKIVGAVDMFYIDREGNGHIVDWKFVEEINLYDRWGKKGICELTADDDACNYNKYLYQLTNYQIILTQEYDVPVIALHIVQLHASLDRPQEYIITNNEEKLEKIVKYREKTLGLL
jgi:hypothetical protein